jgi:hypothetical protein
MHDSPPSLVYLKGKEAKFEEAKELANSSLALYMISITD